MSIFICYGFFLMANVTGEMDVCWFGFVFVFDLPFVARPAKV